MSVEVQVRRREAEQRYARALATRAIVRPGEPGYHDAVHEVGVAWALLARIERERRPAVPADRT